MCETRIDRPGEVIEDLVVYASKRKRLDVGKCPVPQSEEHMDSILNGLATKIK